MDPGSGLSTQLFGHNYWLSVNQIVSKVQDPFDLIQSDSRSVVSLFTYHIESMIGTITFDWIKSDSSPNQLFYN